MTDIDREDRPGSPLTAVLLHPNPRRGGSRFYPVIDRLHHGLAVSTVRFDFPSDQPAEAAAATRAVLATVSGPVVLVGYSFGADVGLAVDDPAVVGWFLVAAPLRYLPEAAVPVLSVGIPAATDVRPKHFLVPDSDHLCPPSHWHSVTLDWVATSMEVVSDADHFLRGQEDHVLAAAARWIASVGF